MFNIVSHYENANQSTFGFHLTPIKMPRSIKQVTPHAGKDMEKGAHSFGAGVNANLFNHYEYQGGTSSGGWKRSTSGSNYTLGYLPKGCFILS